MVKTIIGGVTVSWGNYNTKDLWVAIFCYVMIMYTIRCEFGEMNAKYQMHLRLRELPSPLHSTAYPSIEISEDTLDTSIHCFSNYLKTQFVRSYSNRCTINDCFVCNNSN